MFTDYEDTMRLLYLNGSKNYEPMSLFVCVSLVRKAEILHLLSQPKSEAKITVVPTPSFVLGRHHKDNIATINGPEDLN